MLLWLAHCVRNFLWDARRDCFWWHGAFPFRDLGLPRTRSSSVVYPGSLDSLCSSSDISSSSAWAMGLILNGPGSQILWPHTKYLAHIPHQTPFDPIYQMFKMPYFLQHAIVELQICHDMDEMWHIIYYFFIRLFFLLSLL